MRILTTKILHENSHEKIYENSHGNYGTLYVIETRLIRYVVLDSSRKLVAHFGFENAFSQPWKCPILIQISHEKILEFFMRMSHEN